MEAPTLAAISLPFLMFTLLGLVLVHEMVFPLKRGAEPGKTSEAQPIGLPGTSASEEEGASPQSSEGKE